MSRKYTVILLLFTWLMLGSGLLAYVHNLQHEMEDACCATGDCRGEHHHHDHDDNNCAVHAQLHAPVITSAITPPLMISMGLVERRKLQRLSAPPQATVHIFWSRGPPAC